jgi:hypothetical protein
MLIKERRLDDDAGLCHEQLLLRGCELAEFHLATTTRFESVVASCDLPTVIASLCLAYDRSHGVAKFVAFPLRALYDRCVTIMAIWRVNGQVRALLCIGKPKQSHSKKEHLQRLHLVAVTAQLWLCWPSLQSSTVCAYIGPTKAMFAS